MSRILITGCSKGLGGATAIELARRGHEVIAMAPIPRHSPISRPPHGSRST